MTTNQRVRKGMMKKKGKSKETKKRMRKKKTNIFNMSMTRNKRKKENLQMKMITNLYHRFKRALVILNKVLKRPPQATRRTGTKHQVRQRPQMKMMMKMTFLQMVVVTKMRQRRRLKV